MSLSPNILTCDTREPPRIHREILEKRPTAVRKKLDEGDYGSISNAGPWLCERKEANDYLNCLTDGSLYTQFQRLLNTPEYNDFTIFLLPEGHILPSDDGKAVRVARGKRQWNYRAVYHSYIELVALGVHILPVVPPRFTAHAIIQLDDTMNNGITYLREKHRRPMSLTAPSGEAERFLAPMLGEAALKHLHPHFGNVWSLFTAVMEEPEKLLAVKHIGPSTVERLQRLLLAQLWRR